MAASNSFGHTSVLLAESEGTGDGLKADTEHLKSGVKSMREYFENLLREKNQKEPLDGASQRSPSLLLEEKKEQLEAVVARSPDTPRSLLLASDRGASVHTVHKLFAQRAQEAGAEANGLESLLQRRLASNLGEGGTPAGTPQAPLAAKSAADGVPSPVSIASPLSRKAIRRPLPARSKQQRRKGNVVERSIEELVPEQVQTHEQAGLSELPREFIPLYEEIVEATSAADAALTAFDKELIQSADLLAVELKLANAISIVCKYVPHGSPKLRAVYEKALQHTERFSTIRRNQRRAVIVSMQGSLHRVIDRLRESIVFRQKSGKIVPAEGSVIVDFLHRTLAPEDIQSCGIDLGAQTDRRPAVVRLCEVLVQQRHLVSPSTKKFKDSGATYLLGKQYAASIYANSAIVAPPSRRSALLVSQDLLLQIVQLLQIKSSHTLGVLAIPESEECIEWAHALSELQLVDVTRLPQRERLAFWINVHNLMVVHQHLRLRFKANLNKSKLSGFFSSFSYLIGGFVFSISDVRKVAIRGRALVGEACIPLCMNVFDPRAELALTLCTASSPPALIFSNDISNDLNYACELYCTYFTIVNILKREVELPKVFSWNADAFGGRIQCLRGVASFLSRERGQMILDLLAQEKEGRKLSVSYTDSDWTVDIIPSLS